MSSIPTRAPRGSRPRARLQDWAAGLLLGALLLPAPAWAFCGTYVGSGDEELLNEYSEVVLSRQGNETTLTLAMDYTGSASDFALLLPVPTLLDRDQIRVLDGSLLEHIGLFTAPRAVAYDCEQLLWSHARVGGGCGFAFGCSDYSAMMQSDSGAGAGDDAAETVTVERAYSIAAYDIVILSAEESTGLVDWLTANGYALPPGGEAVIQSYIDAGAYFLAAKIDLDAGSPSGQMLPPLQLSYTSEVFSLPIRIGTISSPGEQELVIYTITDAAAGEVGISNYPEAELPHDCMVNGEQPLSDLYPSKLDEAFGAQEGASWLLEYSWDLNIACDPCTTDQPWTPEELQELGFQGGDYHLSAHITRLHLRYTPEQATQDLVLYETGISGEQNQMRFISYNPSLESLFPICEEGFVPNPGTCWDEGISTETRSCGNSGAYAGGIFMLGALLGLRRRR